MKLNKKIKIEAIASNDSTRHGITAPFLEVENGKGNLIATNGRGIVVVPVDISENDVSGHISIPALKASRKGKILEPSLECLEKTISLQDGTILPRIDLGSFPKWQQVIPDQEGKTLRRVALNAEMLFDIASAMGTKGVILEFDAGNFDQAPIKVFPKNSGKYNEEEPACPDAFGVIMPIRLS
jgi:hypothetical protein